MERKAERGGGDLVSEDVTDEEGERNFYSQSDEQSSAHERELHTRMLFVSSGDSEEKKKTEPSTLCRSLHI